MAIFGSKDKAADTASKDAKKGPRILGTLFNPDIGTSLKPLGETGRTFVNLLAMIFASNGLFPRNHPAVLGAEGAPRLGLSEVVGTAWRNVRFTREGAPQALMFVAVMLCIGFTVLAIFTALFAVMTGSAHAQGAGGGVTCSNTSPFATCNDPSQDISNSWIDYLFNGVAITGYTLPNGQVIPQSPYAQSALISALGFYSDAILIVAALVLFYHLASMVVETAHHGVVMGKRANQIWAPIRLVFAIGLLVPISGGLNSGQFIVVQVAKWGGGMASQAWAIFLNKMVQDQWQYVVPNVPLVRKVTTQMVSMEACSYAYNYYLNLMNTSGSGLGDQPIPVPTPTEQDLPNNKMKFSFAPGSSGVTIDTSQLCGSYILTKPSAGGGGGSTIDSQIQAAKPQAAQDALNSMAGSFQSYAQKGMQPIVTTGQTIPLNDGFDALVSQYQDALQNAWTSDLGTLTDNSMNDAANLSATQGWLSAGAWFNTIARIQGEVMDTAALVPVTTQPEIMEIAAKNGDVEKGLLQNTADSYGTFSNWLSQEAPSSGSQTDPIKAADAGMAQEEKSKTDTGSGMLEQIFKEVDIIAAQNCVWIPANGKGGCGSSGSGTSTGFTLGVQFTSANPLAEIAAFGHGNINVAYDLFDKFIALGGLGGAAGAAGSVASAIFSGHGLISLFGNVAGGAAKLGGASLSALADIYGTICVVFFVAGFMLAYFLPLIPFFRFLFGILSWFLSLIEAIICMPLVALAHLNPEGDGLPGASGKTAYFFLFNIFLRPILMVFGLIAGLLIFFLAASAMNLLYIVAVASTGSLDLAQSGHIALSRIVYSILYIVVLYMCANSAFKMIDWLPNHCIKWMGGQSLHHESLGDVAQVGEYMGLAGGYVEQKIVGSVGQLMKSPAGAIAAAGMLKNNPQGMKNTLMSVGNDLGGPEAKANVGKLFDKGKDGVSEVDKAVKALESSVSAPPGNMPTTNTPGGNNP